MNILSTKVDFSSLLKKGIPTCKDDFAIYLVTGYQGSGKTYFSIYTIERLFKNKTIYTNIHSYKSKKNKIIYFKNIQEIYSNTEPNCIFLIDELAKKYNRNSPIDLQFYSWLQQSRKRSRYVYLITQEYLQVPTWLRGIATLVYTTSKVKFLPLFHTVLGVPYLDTDTMDWSVEPIASIIYKRTYNIASLYDTFETIDEL